MVEVTIADAKAHLAELLNRAARGESICITRRGKPVARLIAVDAEPDRVDVAGLKKLTSAMPRQKQSAGAFLRTMRDEDRY